MTQISVNFEPAPAPRNLRVKLLGVLPSTKMRTGYRPLLGESVKMQTEDEARQQRVFRPSKYIRDARVGSVS